MSIDKIFPEILEKYDSINVKMLAEGLHHTEFAKLSKEASKLSDVVQKIKKYQSANEEIINLNEILKTETDKEMLEMANDEKITLEKSIPNLERDIKVSLLPKDENDDKNVIMEIRAGTGGDEAALFAGVLFKMYQRFCEKKRWKFDVLESSFTDGKGVKEATICVSGNGAFGLLKYESGTHRVQRVPETENSGRVHTSAATVAILPELEEIDIKIEDKDIRTDVFRSSGPGGQSVNTTDSAVRVTHIPTGIVVSCQDGKSQLANRDQAMKILRSRIYEAEENKRNASLASDRKSQIGTGDRSEKIRTYNYPQGRITDHRINLTVYNIDKFTNDGDLDEMIESLKAEDEATKMAKMEGW